MSKFTETNFPSMPQVSGSSVSAMQKLADAYAAAKNAFEGHVNEHENGDPHGLKSYTDAEVSKVKEKANKALHKADAVEKFLIGHNFDTASFGQTVADFVAKKLDNQGVIEVIVALMSRIESLEKELNTLSLIQFDNVPVGAGIRWYKDTLPADGTYVWANGQTLYGVNQNFPELARVWEIGSSDNVKVPKEDHTIFKVRKADRKVTAIQHAYIEAASGEAPATLADVQAVIQSLTGTMATLQTAVNRLSTQGA